MRRTNPEMNRTVALCGLLLIALTACQPAPAPITPARAAELKWQTLCSSCHGLEGRGDGVAAQNLQPPPRTLTDPAWQDKTTDERIRKVVVEGGASVGLSPAMPPNPDLASRPEVVTKLVEKIRGLRAAAPTPGDKPLPVGPTGPTGPDAEPPIQLAPKSGG